LTTPVENQHMLSSNINMSVKSSTSLRLLAVA